MSKLMSRTLATQIVDTLALELYRCNAGSSHANNLKGLHGPTRALYRKMAKRAMRCSRESFIEAKCVKCGCTDSKACGPGCSWVVVNRLTSQGICSECA